MISGSLSKVTVGDIPGAGIGAGVGAGAGAGAGYIASHIRVA